MHEWHMTTASVDLRQVKDGTFSLVGVAFSNKLHNMALG